MRKKMNGRQVYHEEHEEHEAWYAQTLVGRVGRSSEGRTCWKLMPNAQYPAAKRHKNRAKMGGLVERGFSE